MSVPTHISPFAASTIGEPNVGDPCSVEAFWRVVVNMCCVMLRSSVHLKTSRSEDEMGSTFCSPDEVCKFDIDDMRDMAEKCEGDGEATSWRWNCWVATLPLEDKRDECGDDRSRETVGCRYGRAIFEDTPLTPGEPIL
jgi:hypothetical protein